MNEAYKIVLADRTQIDGLRLNGNNFVSDEPIGPSVFKDNLSLVTIYHGDAAEVHENMELVQITQMGDEYWFILRDIPQSEIENARREKRITALEAQLAAYEAAYTEGVNEA
jgi:hypothetical protein